MSQEIPGRPRKAIQAMAPDSHFDNFVRTLKSFIAAEIGAVIVIAKADVTNIKAMQIALTTAAVTFILNLILKWTATK